MMHERQDRGVDETANAHAGGQRCGGASDHDPWRGRASPVVAEQPLITQPALARTIKQLETVLEVDLLERDSRHVALTPVGAEFLIRAQQVLTALDQALASVREHVTIRIGFSWLLPDPWAQRTVSSYEQQTGNAVSLLRVDDPLAAVIQGRIDVAVVRGTIDTALPARVVPLFDEARVAVCSVASELAGYRP